MGLAVLAHILPLLTLPLTLYVYLHLALCAYQIVGLSFQAYRYRRSRHIVALERELLFPTNNRELDKQLAEATYLHQIRKEREAMAEWFEQRSKNFRDTQSKVREHINAESVFTPGQPASAVQPPPQKGDIIVDHGYVRDVWGNKHRIYQIGEPHDDTSIE
jgi:hypothetical protein